MSLGRLFADLVRSYALRQLRRVVTDEVGPKAAASVVRSAVRHYEEHEPELPHEETAGARLMVRLAALTDATYSALVEHGFPDPHARRLTAAVTWRVYRTATRPVWHVTRLYGRDRLSRTDRTMRLLFRLPFAPPGYRVTISPRTVDEAAFDVYRCPVADYFRDRGRLDLCVETFCDLDFPLAKQWGVELHRPGTLSRGFPCCDFRFRKPA